MPTRPPTPHGRDPIDRPEPTVAPTAFGRDFFQAPLRYLDRLRTDGPAHEVVLPGGVRAWVVTDHAEARRLLGDPRLSKARKRRAELLARRGGFTAAQDNPAMGSHLLAADPPDHTRLRALVSRAFTARRVNGLRPRIEQITAELLDALPVDTEIDLVGQFAVLLPMTVITELLGFPDGDRERFRALADTLFATAAEPGERERAVHAYVEFVRRHLDRVRHEPDDGLLSALVAARHGSDQLSEDELTSVSGLLLTAGYETTVNLVSSAVFAVLTRPDLRAALRADPDLVPAAVEETLRHATPSYLATPRFTVADVECGGVTIPALEIVYISLLAANHDPARFPTPATFDLARAGTGHLAFGHGIHHCLGAPLARLEAEVALRGLLDRFPEIALTVGPASLRLRESLLVHGLERLPVRLRPAGDMP